MDRSQDAATPPAQHVATRLRAATMSFTRQLRAVAPADALSPARIGILGHLYRLGPMSPTQLAALERVKLQTLTRVLAELEAGDLIRRRAHQRDARQSVLALAPAGKRLLRAEMGQRVSLIAAAVQQALTKEEQESLLAMCDLIERITDALAANANPAEGAFPSDAVQPDTAA
jgi:DNA-binding MarR family transcriptional regulator